MKPIETVYRHYRFRSRLEARWAVFFDYLGIDFEYEPEGYEMDRDDLPENYTGSNQYLPDFFLPEYGVYVEVKPLPMDDDTFAKLSTFGKEKSILVIQGTPGVSSYFVTAFHRNLPIKAPLVFGSGGFLCNRLWLAYHEKGFPLDCDNCEGCNHVFSGNSSRPHGGMIFAYKSARFARFEYGEKPIFYGPDYEAQKQLTWEKIIRIEPRVYDLYQEAWKYRKRGVQSREDCSNQVWYEEGGLKDHLCRLVGFGCDNTELFGPYAYDIAYQKIYWTLPDCNENCCVWTEERERREQERIDNGEEW